MQVSGGNTFFVVIYVLIVISFNTFFRHSLTIVALIPNEVKFGKQKTNKRGNKSITSEDQPVQHKPPRTIIWCKDLEWR